MQSCPYSMYILLRCASFTLERRMPVRQCGIKLSTEGVLFRALAEYLSFVLIRDVESHIV